MAKSTISAKPRKAVKRVSRASRPKPHPDYPLFWHHSGRWAKKVRKTLHYFGRVEADPKGEAALELWNDQKDDLLAGRKPRKKGDEGLTVRDLCNRFLSAKDDALAAGEITRRTRIDYKRTTDRLIEQFGRTRLVDDLASDDFEKLRARIAKTNGPVALGNEITRIRVVFRYAYEAGLIERPVRYGATFKRPSKKVLRKVRAENGEKMFSADEIKALLAAASPQLRAMILLGINCGFGNHDVGNLRASALDLKEGWANFPRPKTGINRRCALWPETVEAIRAATADRPAPKDGTDPELVFVTKYGGAWAKDEHDSPVTKETRKLLEAVNVYECEKCDARTLGRADESGNKCAKCGELLTEPKQKGIYRAGLGFYALRHTFRTIADETRDFPAIDHIMGHADSSMAGHYRERIGDERLQVVSEHVRAWLFGTEMANASRK